MESVLKVALGVFIGALAAMFAWEGIQVVRLEYAAARMKEDLQRMAETKRRQAAGAVQARADEARNNEITAAVAQRAEATRRSDAEAKKVAREQAWTRFFQRSPKCVLDSGTVECANEYMRSKKRFDEAYVQ